MNPTEEQRLAPSTLNEPEFDPEEREPVVIDPDVGPNQTEMPKEVLGEQAKPAQATEPEKETSSRRLPTVVAMENRYLQATDLDGRYRLASAFFKSGMVPKGYKSPAAVFAGMELAQEHGLRPFTALRNIAVINGSPAFWGDLPLGLVRRSGKLDRIEEFWFDKEYKRICFENKNLNTEAYGALCRTWRKGDEGRYHETYFTLDDAKKAGLLPAVGDAAWFKYTRRMLQMRARTQNLKDQHGDVLFGIEIAEYDYNFIPQRDVTPEGIIGRDGQVSRDVAAELNKTLEKPNAGNGH